MFIPWWKLLIGNIKFKFFQVYDPDSSGRLCDCNSLQNRTFGSNLFPFDVLIHFGQSINGSITKEIVEDLFSILLLKVALEGPIRGSYLETQYNPVLKSTSGHIATQGRAYLEKNLATSTSIRVVAFSNILVSWPNLVCSRSNFWYLPSLTSMIIKS
jgi:hypothetical protein